MKKNAFLFEQIGLILPTFAAELPIVERRILPMAMDKEPTGEDEIPVVDSDTETETDTDREIIGGVHSELVADVSVSGADDEETESDVAAEPMRVVEVKQKSSRFPAKKRKRLIGEDVCFICFDGGELFLCDRR